MSGWASGGASHRGRHQARGADDFGASSSTTQVRHAIALQSLERCIAHMVSLCSRLSCYTPGGRGGWNAALVVVLHVAHACALQNMRPVVLPALCTLVVVHAALAQFVRCLRAACWIRLTSDGCIHCRSTTTCQVRSLKKDNCFAA